MLSDYSNIQDSEKIIDTRHAPFAIDMSDFFAGARYEDLVAWAVAVTLWLAVLAYVAEGFLSTAESFLSTLPT